MTMFSKWKKGLESKFGLREINGFVIENEGCEGWPGGCIFGLWPKPVEIAKNSS